jgi:hypothetical protein
MYVFRRHINTTLADRKQFKRPICVSMCVFMCVASALYVCMCVFKCMVSKVARHRELHVCVKNTCTHTYIHVYTLYAHMHTILSICVEYDETKAATV